MLANFLNKSKPINFIGLLIFFFFCYIINVLLSVFKNGFALDSLLESTILLFLFLGVFFFYNFILSKNKLTFDNSFAFFLFTVLLVSLLAELSNFKSLILVIIYLFFLRKVYRLRTSRILIKKLFDCGFWLGVLFILEPLSILFLVIIFIGVFLHQKITLNTLFVPIIGFATPLFIYFTYLFWIDKTIEFTELFNYTFNYDIELYKSSKYIRFFTSIFIVSFVSIVFKSIATLAVNNTFRKSWYLLIANFLIVIIFLILKPEKNGSEILYILFPVSVICANGVELVKKQFIKNLLLYFFLIGSILLCFSL